MFKKKKTKTLATYKKSNRTKREYFTNITNIVAIL